MGMNEFFDDMDKFFNEFLGSKATKEARGESTEKHGWAGYCQRVDTPALFSMRIMDDAEKSVVVFILLGRDPQDVNVELSANEVVVRVEKEVEFKCGENVATAAGIGFDTGALTIKLPYEVNTTPISKEYKNGLLTLHLTQKIQDRVKVEI
jgi:HSP20 family molecular chaperone IbpA